MRASFVAMALLVLLAAMHYTIADGSDISWCGSDAVLGEVLDPNLGVIEARIVFVSFPSPEGTPADSLLPAWANDFEVDLPAFVRNMSGQVSAGLFGQDLHLRVMKRPGANSMFKWVAPHPSTYYRGGDIAHSVWQLNLDVLTKVAVALNPDTTWSGVNVIGLVYSECTQINDAIGTGDCTKITGEHRPPLGVAPFGIPDSITAPSLDRSTTLGVEVAVLAAEYAGMKPATEEVFAHEYM